MTPYNPDKTRFSNLHRESIKSAKPVFLTPNPPPQLGGNPQESIF